MLLFFTTQAVAAPYAALVMDARNGKVLHSRNADTRLHPASLTKMMTLYVVFEAVENGEISLDTKVTISRKAAAEPPSKLGLQAGQKIALRYLIRAAAIKSGNDAATALGEAIEGSEAAFARRMNRTAKALGMTRSTFKNAHGLTEAGHLSTARDMTILGRHLFYDYPDYYNLFSRVTTHAGIKNVSNTNRRLLGAYRGADGIKTGYTRAAGYNLTASAERGQERIIATVFGGRSTATRNARVAELLDMGFSRAPSRVAVQKPSRPMYDDRLFAGKTLRTNGLITASLRPMPRPGSTGVALVTADAQDEIDAAVASVAEAIVADVVASVNVDDTREAMGSAAIDPEPLPQIAVLPSDVQPRPRPDDIAGDPVVVTRLSTSGNAAFGVTIGQYATRNQAERALLKTALVELATLDSALRKVVQSSGTYQANFIGLSEERAELACRRLEARNITCEPIGQ
ncbi:MAG: serine hydrolase [Pseudomonadota bacterium]